MEAEIELKLFFPENKREALVSLLNSLPHSDAKGATHLTNSYYDTPELQLRQWDMGLRVRGRNGTYEQTIKTAGTVVGGVHSRPEYNIDIDQAKVNLSLFPQAIWPQGADIDAVQASLVSLFDTDFTRMSWHIYIDESLVEVALDIGSITAQGISEPLCELEFELLAGDAQALLSLASRVTEQIPARLGRASKAQRGYRLAAMASPLQLETLEFIALPQGGSLKQALVTLLETGLDRWQQLEAMLLESREARAQLPLLGYRLRACIRLLRCTLEQFSLLDDALQQAFAAVEAHLDFVEPGLSLCELLDNDGALLGNLSEPEGLLDAVNLQLSEMAIPQQIDAMLMDVAYGHLQVRLVSLLMAINAGQVRIDELQSLQIFADTLQEASWQRIVELMPSNAELSSEDYQSFAKALDESIFVGVAYGELYRQKPRDQFRAPWQDLVLGIRTLAAYRRLREIATQLGRDIGDWLDNKEQSLLFAMEHSRRSALKVQPYWR
ncbi:MULTISPECIES: CYTH domain-containing protein [Shewanella]|uniref:Adenylate cyclase n=1 Tax=Shewanella marisflavi TaxID=260364 RepID=A0AAC9TXM0_9GAMM|nr:CYTH domain-containing protein [Shewanella marisflavi]ASJ95643.1 adenylate cyclase [Shewanella marisflavi]MCL1041611.1 CYTH domain-containing protein [Shewanella marisflavi]